VRLAAYVIVLAAVIVLLYPGSKAGQAVVAVTNQTKSMLGA
jgi:hypothetical protein